MLRRYDIFLNPQKNSNHFPITPCFLFFHFRGIIEKRKRRRLLSSAFHICKRCNPFYSKDQVLSFARGCISASASSMDVWLLVASIPAGDITRMSAVGLVYASLLIACSLIVSFSLVSLYFKVLFASEHHLLAVMDVDAVLLRIVHLHALQVEVGRVRSEE